MMLTPTSIKKKLDEIVIGQDKAKKGLAVTIYDHMKIKGNPNLENSTTLVVGPTGTGKTLMVSSLSKILDLPFITFDVTTISPNGFKGENIINILEKLFYEISRYYENKSTAHKEELSSRRTYLDDEKQLEEIKKFMERGIIFLDEFDKLAGKKIITSDGACPGLEIQYELLKLFEGSERKLSVRFNRKEHDILINTKNILFILGGAFTGIHDLEKTDKVEKVIGFNKNRNMEKKIREKSNEDKEINIDDLKKFGIIQELAGRITKVVNFHQLNEEQFVKILTEPKNSIINQYKDIFKMDNIDLEFSEEALVEIAKTALESNIGARGLRAIIEKSISEIKFLAPSCKNLSKIIITKEGLENYMLSIFKNDLDEEININYIKESDI